MKAVGTVLFWVAIWVLGVLTLGTSPPDNKADGLIANLLYETDKYSEAQIDSILALPRITEGSYVQVSKDYLVAYLYTFDGSGIPKMLELYNHREKKR